MRKLLIVLLVLAVVGLLAVGWWKYSLSSVNPTDQKARTFVISKGDGVREVAKKLHDSGLVRDQVAFFLLVKRLGIEKNIQAGSYKLAPAMSAYDLALKLTRGTEDVWITIPEGWRTEEVLAYLQRQMIDEGKWNMDEEIMKWKVDEGKYFPETYLVPKQITIDGVRSLMLSTFEKRFTGQMKEDAAARSLPAQQVVILASMVEREARTEADRPVVAGIMFNRLTRGMSLDVDATVQYAIGFTAADGWWKKNLTQDDLKLKSPYNTYLNAGLPAGPISNPGLSALRAVVYPAKSEYLYYLTDKQGNMHYARTLEEHSQNVAKYLTP